MAHDGTGGWRLLPSPLPAATGAAMSDRHQLRGQMRREMRERRRSLPASMRESAHRQFARSLARAHLLQPGRRVAIYFAYGHEADLSDVIALARRRGCRLYLPVITHIRHNRMRFVRYERDSVMRTNRYGIPEPVLRHAAIIPVRQLDLVLLPLVAFDARGWRLGSGAGFYDRSLQRLREGRRWRRPLLIGVGYECQRVPRLEPDYWDVPLDRMLTERGLRRALRSPVHSR